VALALTQGGTASAWTTTAAVQASNGVDKTGDSRLIAGYLTGSGVATADWTLPSNGAISLSIAAIQLTPAAVTVPNANWPLTQLQIGWGAGPGTPRDQITWTDMTARMVTFGGNRGRSYELDQLQAGTATIRLRNNDGALDPTNATSTYYPNVQIGTPIRVLATWAGVTYPVWHGYAERWPQTWDTETGYGWVDLVATDAYATLGTALRSLTRSEKLLDAPYGYWPLDDGAGNTLGANLVASQFPITQVLSKNGAGSAAAAFGANSGLISGDGGTTSWGMTGLTSPQSINGYCLQYADTSLPQISGGVTIELWAHVEITQPTTGDLVIWAAKDGSGTAIQLYLDQVNGYPTIAVWDQYTRARTNSAMTSWGDRRNASYTHYVVTFDQGAWALHVNGAAGGPALTGTCNLPGTWNLLSVCGQADKFTTGGMVNGSYAHLAVYPRKLDNARIWTHYLIDTWFNSDLSDSRLHRHLSHAPAGVPRVIDQADTRLGNLPDTAGRSIADCLWDPALTDNGVLYVDGGGYIQYRSKQNTANPASQWTLGDGPGETPMERGVAFDYDATQVKNDVTISQAPGEKATGGATELTSGVIANATDTASIARYGDITYARTVYFSTKLGYSYGTTDLANWLLHQFSGPQLRTETITLNPAKNPGSWPTALGIEIGDVVTINRRPTYAQAISRLMTVQSITHTLGAVAWTVALELTPIEARQITVDDPAYGLLDGANAIGY
jgi:hypothetical protein